MYFISLGYMVGLELLGHFDLVSCKCAEFFNSNSCFSGFLRIFYIQDNAVYKYSFTSFFPKWMHFLSFSCLIALDITSSTMLNGRKKSRHPSLFPDFREKALNFLPLSAVLYVSFSVGDLY